MDWGNFQMKSLIAIALCSSGSALCFEVLVEAPYRVSVLESVNRTG